MSQYYYAVSSLPQLYFESESYPSSEQFLTLCEENLSKGDLHAVRMLDDAEGNIGGPSLLKKWSAWNRSFKADLAILRGQQLGKNVEDYQQIERVSGTEDLAREAFQAANPLAAEEVVERGRWQVLEELEVGHYFDLQKLLIYKLKISILDRMSSFDKDKGQQKFRELYDTVTEEKIGVQPE